MDNEYTILVRSEQETELLGEKIGKVLSGGEVIVLVSDLGGGKTTFTRGLARGIGAKQNVSSPTFTISNVYEGTSLVLYHYDFYRLAELGVLSDELKERVTDPRAIVVIEWADEAENIIPKARTIRVYITPSSDDENARQFRICYGDTLEEIRGVLR